jgi:NAD-dependent dihydropyrimidine dehydrogenase PreA subunit
MCEEIAPPGTRVSAHECDVTEKEIKVMSTNDHYASLVEKLGYGGSDRLAAVLKALMTPDQAIMADALPGTAADVAEITGFDAEDIQKNLDELFFKGVVFARGDFVTREYFRFARGMGQLHDATLATCKLDVVKDAEYFKLWQDFCLNEWYPEYGKQKVAQERPVFRVVPAYKAFENMDGVLPCEDYRELIKAQEVFGTVPCSCRMRTAGVGEPCGHTDEEKDWTCLQFGRGADYIDKRGSGRKLTLEEALEVVDVIEENALIHIWRNSTVMGGARTSCNCCRDCCADYVPMDMFDLPLAKSWEKSRWEAVIDQDKCDGCQDCIERCHFDAIELVKPEKPAKGKKAKKMKAVVEPEKCWGCGVCVPGCKEAKAIGFKVVRPEEFIPQASVPAH